MNDTIKPTVEEVEKCAREIWMLNHPGSEEDPYRVFSPESQYLTLAKWHLTHLSTITKERDEALLANQRANELIGAQAQENDKINSELRTQLEIEQSKVVRCVEFLQKTQENLFIHREFSLSSGVKNFLSSLPATPNLVARVRELEKELATVNYDLELRRAME